MFGKKKQIGPAAVIVAVELARIRSVLESIYQQVCKHDDLLVKPLEEDNWILECLDCGKVEISKKKDIKRTYKGKELYWQDCRDEV